MKCLKKTRENYGFISITKTLREIKFTTPCWFSFKSNGQLVYDLADCGRCHRFVLNTCVFLTNFQALTSHLRHRIFSCVSSNSVIVSSQQFRWPLCASEFLVIFRQLDSFAFLEDIVLFWIFMSKCCWLKKTRFRSVERRIWVHLRTNLFEKRYTCFVAIKASCLSFGSPSENICKYLVTSTVETTGISSWNS